MTDKTPKPGKYVTHQELQAALEQQTKFIINALTDELASQLGAFMQIVHNELAVSSKTSGN